MGRMLVRCRLQKGFWTFVVQTTQRVSTFLPESLRGEVFGITCGRARWSTREIGINALAGNGYRELAMAEPPFRSKGCLTAASCSRDPLSPFGVGHITGRKDPVPGGFWSAGACGDIPLFIKVQLFSEEIGVWRMSNRVKQPTNL